MRTTPKSEVSETTEYDNLIDEVSKVERYEFGSQKTKPKENLSGYPFTLKVHTWTLGDTEKFAQTIRKRLSSDTKRFVYTDRETKLENCVYVEKRKNPFLKRTTHKSRRETLLWKDTLGFRNDGWNPYITFEITFKSREQFEKFARRVKQRVSLNRPFMNFPERKPKVWKYHWVSQWEDHNPKYPIYIVSKGRGDSRLTSRCLERIRVPYYVAIEPQDYDEYACVIDEKKLLVLPFSNHGDGPGRARNWCWDHSMKNGFKRHWVMDDNITDFYRLHNNRKLPVGDGGMFRVIEEFVDRFENVPLSGLQYDFFTIDKSPYPPFVLNTRIYSVLLIENSCPVRWRGRYNEDTILSLDLLKLGYTTMQFNCLLQGKSPTQNLGGGNTAEFYGKEGTYNKSKMLEVIHPDVARVEWRYNRFHHHVDYRPFKDNEPVYVDGYDPEKNRSETDLFKMERVKDYLIKRDLVSGPKSEIK